VDLREGVFGSRVVGLSRERGRIGSCEGDGVGRDGFRCDGKSESFTWV
jgi:hypothetical protein